MIILTTTTKTVIFILIIQISKDESHNELNSSPQLYSMEPNKIVNQEYKTLLLVRPSKSTSISVKHNGTT